MKPIGGMIMNNLLKIAVAIKEDVNKEESIIISQYSKCLTNIINIILWFGIPFLIYIILQFIQL